MDRDLTRLPTAAGGDMGIIAFCISTLFERDNRELAERLIRRFGGATGIFRSSYEELMGVNGMTERAASFFSVMARLRRQAALREADKMPVLSEMDLIRFAAVYFMYERRRGEVCLCLDERGMAICAVRLTGAERLREIVSIVCAHNARIAAVINRNTDLKRVKRGIYPPTDEWKTVSKLARVLSSLGVRLADYVEYNDCMFFSYADSTDGMCLVKNISEADTAPRGEVDWQGIADEYDQRLSARKKFKVSHILHLDKK